MPPKSPIAYIDANVFKFSATALLRLFPRTQVIDCGSDGMFEHKYYEPRYVNPNDKIKDVALRSEVDLLEAVAQLVKTGRLAAVTDIETHFESWGLPKMDSWTGKFYRAPVAVAPPPIQCDRLLFCAGRDAVEMQREFLREIKHPRFVQLQKMTGAYQGEDRYCWRQMLDAFALWCAEYNSCDYFLTLDRKLINHLRRRKQRPLYTRVVWPSELLSVIQG